MKIIDSLKNFHIDFNTGVALGSFDGVHIGHRALIVNLVDICKKNGFKSVVYTFQNHPRNLTQKVGSPKRIMPDDKKFMILSELGVDYTVCVKFDEYQRSLLPEKFIKEILKDQLKMSYAVVGFDYHFGYKAQGDVNLLHQLKDQYDYDLMVVNAVEIQNEVLSSTKIREYIKYGNIGKANLFLGRNYSILGKVIHGKNNGKKFGFPTANIAPEEGFVIPNPGVYFTKTIVQDKIYNSITNVGSKPTLGKNPIGIETHIINFDGDLYEKKIEILFFQKARDEVCYTSVDDLITQVNKDIEEAQKFFNI
ncbi:bifunctional riboflavin kinase/FAD synthetase [Anaerophilus nitritogenes]|uniref:bifunctional riboflavin kinase/FAD synthetase n=1 Tax=Anaerophilus nitritogenes TaxID=2498136 RepID=UPI00101CEEDA|nr:bifunctional riboflavin kinase/FAD synthetase [Anaerophilus nitritogenes]